MRRFPEPPAGLIVVRSGIVEPMLAVLSRARGCCLGLAGSALAAQAVLAPIGTLIAEQSRTAFSIQGAGARAMGMGGAFIGVADDATAVSFNPAGLAQMVKPEASFVGQGLNRRVAFQDAQTVAGARTLLVDDSLISNLRFDPLLLSGTVPLSVGGRTLALQLAIQRQIPLGEGDTRDMTAHPQDGSAPTRLHQGINQDGQIDVYSFALAYECSQRILLGASVNYWRGAWTLDSDSRSTTAGTTTYVAFDQTNHLEGVNYNLGLLWRWPTWSLGIVRRTGFHADYTYQASLQTSTLGPELAAPSFTTGLHWPATTGLGFAWRPRDRWLVAADLVNTPWSDTRYMSSRPGLDGMNFFDMKRHADSQNATQFHLGLERILLFDSGTLVPLRLGFSRVPQPVTDQTTHQQRVVLGLSAGTGLKAGRYTFDVAYRYGWDHREVSQVLDPAQILSQEASTTLGRETLVEHRVEASFIVQFERGPVQDFLHRLFVGD